MNHTVDKGSSAGRIFIGPALGGIVILGLVALGISEYDGYVDELSVYQSLAPGLISTPFCFSSF